MVSSGSLREQKRIELSKKLQLLKTVTKSKATNTNSIVNDAMLYIKNLEFQIEAITRECEGMTSDQKEVTVGKSGNRFMVKVTCKKEEQLLASIVEAFEKLDLLVLQVQTTSEEFFFMEAIVEDEHQVLEVKDVTNAVLEVIDKSV